MNTMVFVRKVVTLTFLLFCVAKTDAESFAYEVNTTTWNIVYRDINLIEYGLAH